MAMTIPEKVSYIKGLAEGLNLDDSTKEGKVLLAMLDVLNDIALDLEEVDEDLDEMAEVLSDVEESVYDLEDEVYGDDDCDDEDEELDDDMYEVTCPNCGNSVVVDYDILSDGEIDCPNCGEKLEFVFDEDDSDIDDSNIIQV